MSEIATLAECHSQQLGRTPRPPNAFILYRSDFLRKRTIPLGVERRQQNLSRIAGQCWNMLPEIEKAIWYGKAAIIRAEYQAKYPSHKASPSRKDANKPLEKNRRGRTANSPHSRGKSRNRPCSEGVFSAFPNRKLASPAPQSGLVFPTSPSDSPLSMNSLPSPLSPPHLLPSFTPYINSYLYAPLPVDFENLEKYANGSLLEPSGFQAPLASQGPYPTFQHYENGFGTRGPFEVTHSEPISQSCSTSSVPDAFPFAGYFHSLANNPFDLADKF